MRPLLLLLIPLGCNSPQSTPVVTVTTMPDAFRRLELLGYSHLKDTNVLGQELVLYHRKFGSAVLSAELARWSGTKHVSRIAFYYYTNEASFNSEDERQKIWNAVEQDLFALVNCKAEYLRAVNSSQTMNGSAARYEGRATTEDGWQIRITEHTGYHKNALDEIMLGAIEATHLETDENIPAAAVNEFNQRLEKSRRNKNE